MCWFLQTNGFDYRNDGNFNSDLVVMILFRPEWHLSLSSRPLVAQGEKHFRVKQLAYLGHQDWHQSEQLLYSFDLQLDYVSMYGFCGVIS